MREIPRVPWTWRWTRFFNADFSHSTCVLVFILRAGSSDQGRFEGELAACFTEERVSSRSTGTFIPKAQVSTHVVDLLRNKPIQKEVRIFWATLAIASPFLSVLAEFWQTWTFFKTRGLQVLVPQTRQFLDRSHLPSIPPPQVSLKNAATVSEALKPEA